MTPHDLSQRAIGNSKILCEVSAALIAKSKTLIQESKRVVACLKVRNSPQGQTGQTGQEL